MKRFFRALVFVEYFSVANRARPSWKRYLRKEERREGGEKGRGGETKRITRMSTRVYILGSDIIQDGYIHCHTRTRYISLNPGPHKTHTIRVELIQYPFHVQPGVQLDVHSIFIPMIVRTEG